MQTTPVRRFSRLSLTIASVCRWLRARSRASSAAAPCQAYGLRQQANSRGLAAVRPKPAPAAGLPLPAPGRAAARLPAQPARPAVQVLRCREGGRLAIVGRMSDVCAELDRLVRAEQPC